MYYHPLFHRDFPDKLVDLRRRTCPGFDGRRNKTPPVSVPPPRYSYDDIDPKYAPRQFKVTPGGSGAGNKVSRSPSPSSTSSGSEPAGNGSVRASTRLRGERNAITQNAMTEEEVSPVTSKKQKTRHSSSSATAVTPATATPSPPSAFHRTVSNISTETMVAPTEESEKYVADKLNSHIQSTSLLEGIVDCATAKSNSDSDDDEFHYYTSANRKKASKEELEELLDHRYDVSEVSRHLDGICSDYAESIKPRGGKRGGRVGAANPVLQFGFDKPDNAYSGTKCDLFTYDYEEGEYIVEEDQQALLTSKKEEEVCKPTPKKVDVALPRPSSPSSCPLLNGRIAQTCLDGYMLMPNTTTLERTVASAILSYCLATHPEDCDADIKLRVHLQKGPMLAREFDMYLMALLPSIDIGPKDRLQAWRSFSLNKLQHIIKLLHDGYAPSSVERVAIKKCADCWFPQVAL